MPIWGFAGEDCPNDTSGFVCHRDRRETNGFAIEKLQDPGMNPVREPAGALNLRGHADHKQPSQVAIAFLGDPTQALFAATRFVEWREPDPGGKLAPVPELFSIADRGDDG